MFRVSEKIKRTFQGRMQDSYCNRRAYKKTGSDNFISRLSPYRDWILDAFVYSTHCTTHNFASGTKLTLVEESRISIPFGVI